MIRYEHVRYTFELRNICGAKVAKICSNTGCDSASRIFACLAYSEYDDKILCKDLF